MRKLKLLFESKAYVLVLAMTLCPGNFFPLNYRNPGEEDDVMTSLAPLPVHPPISKLVSDVSLDPAQTPA